MKVCAGEIPAGAKRPAVPTSDHCRRPQPSICLSLALPNVFTHQPRRRPQQEPRCGEKCGLEKLFDAVMGGKYAAAA